MLEGVARRRIALPETGVEIALLDWGGDRPLALLHHANGFCAATWELVAAELSPFFRVVAMDARGHGDSSAPRGETHYRWERFGRDAAGVARILAREHGPIALGLGHSFGGTALLMAAVEQPDLFGRLVAVDPITFEASAASDPTRQERTRSLVERTRKRRAVFESRETARAQWEGKDLFARWDPRALDLYLAEGLRDRADGDVELKCSPEVEAAIFGSGWRFDAFALAPRVHTPTLVLWARRGDFPRRLYESLTALMPDARVEDADAGHLVPMERPELVASRALAFCESKGRPHAKP